MKLTFPEIFLETATHWSAAAGPACFRRHGWNTSRNLSQPQENRRQ